MFQEGEAGQNHNIKIYNISCVRVGQFTYLETTITNQNSIHGESKSDLIRGILDTVWTSIFCVPVRYLRIQY